MQWLNDTKLYVRAAMRVSSYQVYTADCNYYSIIVIAVHFFTVLVVYENANLLVLFDWYVCYPHMPIGMLGHISFTVCWFVCAQHSLTDISGVGWCRAIKFGRMGSRSSPLLVNFGAGVSPQGQKVKKILSASVDTSWHPGVYGNRHVRIYASPDYWRTCVMMFLSSAGDVVHLMLVATCWVLANNICSGFIITFIYCRSHYGLQFSVDHCMMFTLDLWLWDVSLPLSLTNIWPTVRFCVIYWLFLRMHVTSSKSFAKTVKYILFIL